MSDTEKLLLNLQFHAGFVAQAAEDHVLPRVATKFRPYSGAVDVGLLESVKELAKDFETASLGDNAARTTGGLAIWMIVSTITSWVLDAGGMLQRNKLIDECDASLVRDWLFELEQIGFCLLDRDQRGSKADVERIS